MPAPHWASGPPRLAPPQRALVFPFCSPGRPGMGTGALPHRLDFNPHPHFQHKHNPNPTPAPPFCVWSRASARSGVLPPRAQLSWGGGEEMLEGVGRAGGGG
ncbi:unnamed protein product [Lepidochelys kempii]